MEESGEWTVGLESLPAVGHVFLSHLPHSWTRPNLLKSVRIVGLMGTQREDEKDRFAICRELRREGLSGLCGEHTLYGAG